jgi:hypothetical protein
MSWDILFTVTVLIQFGRKQNEGADPDLIRQRIVEFSEELNLTRPDIWNRAVVISNFMFTQKAHEEDWRIDEVHTGSTVEIDLYLAAFWTGQAVIETPPITRNLFKL